MNILASDLHFHQGQVFFIFSFDSMHAIDLDTSFLVNSYNWL